MIEVLIPAHTELPDKPQQRRHAPKGPWRLARACLRWDFGFTCPFCMLHEADLSEHGAAGEGMIWIEHLEPHSTHHALRDVYTNIIYSCRYCNLSRRAQPRVDSRGRRLLDPCQDAWAEHFAWQGGVIMRARPGDGDAAYTHTAYKLNEEKKLTRRRWRKELFENSQQLIQELSPAIDTWQLGLRAAREAKDIAGMKKALARLRKWYPRLQKAVKDLRRFRAIPKDAPERCRCDTSENRTLPSWLARQTVQVDLPAAHEHEDTER